MSRKPLLANVATMDGALTVAADMLAVDKATPKGDTLRLVPLDALRAAPAQVRGMDATAPALLELADSIRVHGVLEPVLARRTADGLELLAGHRRVAAARLAGLASVPVRVLDDVSDPDAAAITATENLAREDLTPWETMRALAALRDAWVLAGRSVTMRTLAAAAGRSSGAVSEALGVVDALTPAALTAAGLADVRPLNALAWRDLVRAARTSDPVAAVRVLVAPVPEKTGGNTAEKPARKAGGKGATRPRTWALRVVLDDAGAPRADLTGAEVGTLDATTAGAMLDALAPLLTALRARVKLGPRPIVPRRGTRNRDTPSTPGTGPEAGPR